MGVFGDQEHNTIALPDHFIYTRPMPHFADTLIATTRQMNTPLCVGLDPFPDQIPALFGRAGELETLEAFFDAVIEAVSGQVAVVKPQIGLFEPWGSAGVALVGRLSRRARSKGLLVILDAKRGDIGSTAEGYAQAYLKPDVEVACDCITVNPYLGLDSLEPFAKIAQENGKGIAVLVRTSNPGARDFQDLQVDGAPLWTRVGEALAPLETRLLGQEGFSSLMIVCGATWPGEAQRLRAILPKALFLVPGYGAQGGAARDALAGFVRTPLGLEGGVVSSSRGILYPPACAQATTLDAWRTAFDANLQAAILDLRTASESDADVQ
jgi:orotidine-5'-phosphate decarboxylase